MIEDFRKFIQALVGLPFPKLKRKPRLKKVKAIPTKVHWYEYHINGIDAKNFFKRKKP